jgi:hypothetical protein
LSKNTEDLSKILKIIKDIPTDRLIKDFNKPPGWSYHGPISKHENKISPGVYEEATYTTSNIDFNKTSNWYHYIKTPAHRFHVLMPSNYENIVKICFDIVSNTELKVKGIEWSFNNIYEVSILLDHNDKITGSGVNKILAAYNLYKEVYDIEELINIPALSHMTGILDVNTDWNNEPTLVFKDYPYILLEKHKEFFINDSKQLAINGLKYIGIFKLVEDTFHVLVDGPIFYRNKYNYNGFVTLYQTSLGAVPFRRV